MDIITTITPDDEARKKLFTNTLMWLRFKYEVRNATEILRRSIYDFAPKVTEGYANSISSNVAEYDDPYRMVSRVFSAHPLNLVIEYGAIPHEVAIQPILNWVVTKRIGNQKYAKTIAWEIRNSIARNGIKPHFVFTQAYYASDDIFREQLHPTILLLHGGNFDVSSDLLPHQPESYPFDFEMSESVYIENSL